MDRKKRGGHSKSPPRDLPLVSGKTTKKGVERRKGKIKVPNPLKCAATLVITAERPDGEEVQGGGVGQESQMHDSKNGVREGIKRGPRAG